MNRTVLTVLISAILLVIGGIVWMTIRPEAISDVEEIVTTSDTQTQTGTPSGTTPDAGVSSTTMITVSLPMVNQKVSSPLIVTGQARGTWYFEASFPLEIRDASGKVLAQGPAEAQSDWMTTNFVPFRATLTFPTQPTGSKGTLVLKKDNPSGDPERDAQIVVPITF